MKKKLRIIILIVVILMCILCIPFSVDTYKDGGTKTYTSFIYKIIVWHTHVDDYGQYKKTGTEVHFFPNNFHDLDYYEK